MRRILLVLTFMSFAAWSQPAQQQAQPPTVPKAENQPPKPWIHFAELAVPGIVGIAGALIGVLLTNRYNAATIAANRKHELEKLNREHTFALKRDVLIRLTQSLVQTLAALRDWDNWRDTFLVNAGFDSEDERAKTSEAVSNAWKQYCLRRDELEEATAASCLAISDALWNSAQAIGASIGEARKQIARKESPTRTIQQISGKIVAFTKAAKKELGIVHIDA